METKRHADAALIDELGGPAKVAREIGCSTQRVQNWMTRGIPAASKLNRPDLFLYRKAAPEARDAA